MQIGRTILGLLVLAMLCSCETLNKGVSQPERFRVELHAPVGTGFNAPGLFGGCPATFSVTVLGGKGPFSIDWNFGGAATNTSSTLAAPGQGGVSVTLVNTIAYTEFTANVTVSDSTGLVATDSVRFSFADIENSPPFVDSLVYANGVITVSGSDYVGCMGIGDQLTFTAYIVSGAITISPAFNVTDTSAQFQVSPNNILAGADFTVSVTVSDGVATYSDTISGSIEPIPLADDTLYAIASSDTASVGDLVRIVVATGNTANTFQYMNGCGVVCENGASYNAMSFDCGSVDGDPDPDAPIDGVWSDMGASAFLLGNDIFIVGSDLGDGRTRTDFNVTPLGGTDITANGILFNFEYTFAQAGTYHLGFEAVNVVNRSYYSDSAAQDSHFWADIDNDHQYNTIVVE